MQPLTLETPKPLIEVCEKPLLRHVAEALPAEIDELVLVVGYKQEQIRRECGDVYDGKKVVYVEQENFAGGTGDALLCAREVLQGRFMFMYADDIHGKEALAAAVQQEHAILATTSEHPEDFGVIMQNDDGSLQAIVEKPKVPQSKLINIGGFVLDMHVFEYTVAVSEEHGELLVTDMFTQYAQDYPVQVIEQDLWIPVGKPEDIQAAEAVLCPEK